MKRIGLAAALALVFLVNGNFTFAQSPGYQAYELLNLLEYVYPQYLAPGGQVTRLDQNGAFYRRYSDTGIVLRTKDDHLYVVYSGSDSRDAGVIDGFWFPFAQSEILFNWLEVRYPQLLAPAPQATQVEGALFYRAYPETNVITGTFGGNLYALDGQYQLYPLGRADVWLGEILDFQEVLAGVYTIQQKSSDRYVDAYEWSSHDYYLVTRGAQNDDTQKWIITPLGNDTYTIQQKSTMRYVDAYVTDAGSHEYNLVTREAQNDDTQKWIIVPVGDNTYTIQQKSTMRYVDAYETSTLFHDYEVVTRGAQNDDTQRWIFTLIPEDMRFLGIEYDLNEAEIVSETQAVVIATERLVNNSPLEQTMSFAVDETVEEESYFERTEGFEVTVGWSLTVGIPELESSTSISISSDVHWTSGQSVVNSHSYTAVFPLRVEPYGVYRAEACVRKSTVSVPYVMFFESNETGAIRMSKGTWSGVSTWGLECVVTKE